MCSLKFSLLIIICYTFVDITEGMITVRQFVYQRDMSEHCRRRVMPSVFIGRNVVQASAQILHFSQLEVAYSCFISIRTESGANIILTMKIEDDEPAIRDCHKTKESPVKVYEMGETFGGYWGQLPDSILEGTPSTSERYYTLKTQPTGEKKDEDKGSEEDDEDFTTMEPLYTTDEPPDTQEYVTFELPLVNVSARLVPSDEVYVEKEGGFPDLDSFDKFYEVTMDPRFSTRTTIFPLVQFSVGKEESVSRRAGLLSDFISEEGSRESAGEGPRRVGDASGNDTDEPRYQLDIGAFTIDPRLSFLFEDKKKIMPEKKYPAWANRRFNFKKPKLHKPQLFEPVKSKQSSETKDKNDTWTFIEAILKNLTMNKSEQLKEDSSERQRFSALLQRISDWQHNYSAYLAPNLTYSGDALNFEKTTKDPYADLSFDAEGMFIDKDNDEEVAIRTTTKRTTTSTKRDESQTYAYNDVDDDDNDDSPKTTTMRPFEYSATQTMIDVTADLSRKFSSAITETIQSIKHITTTVSDKFQSFSSKPTDTTKSPDSTIRTIETSFVKLKKIPLPQSTTQLPTAKSTINVNLTSKPSWENVVQVAPKMADILNDTMVKPLPSMSRTVNPKNKRRKRKKRSIIAIQVDNAQPHNLTTASDLVPTSEAMYNFVDMQDFAQLVELQDDEIQGHVALRYMRRYVGATVFDLCKEYTSKNASNLVYLFNTSRIVLSLSNFTLRRLTIVATPARMISLPGQKCDNTDLECQVAGSRVCVSQLVACDDVPNCGAADIYDEDRLMCGVNRKVQHDVYLAAFTFLAVLLTVLYTVHYWLKRCVPKVSEAFFIYTNGTENLLYLDSVMRSPTDTTGCDMSKLALPNAELDLAVLGMIEKPSRRKNILRKICCCCCKVKDKSYAGLEMVDLDLDFQNRGKMFSFPEIEISNLQRATPFVKDMSVQTGDSLQIPCYNEALGMFNVERKRQESIDPRVGLRDVRIVRHTSIIQTSQDSELQMMKFFRESKLSAEKHPRPLVDLGIPEEVGRDGTETEIKSTLYNSPILSIDSYTSPKSVEIPPIFFQSIVDKESDIPIEKDVSIPSPVRQSSTSKKLRFDENLMTIDDKLKRLDDDDSDDTVGPEACSSGRDFRRFWQSKSKDKDKAKKDKGKKKTHQLTLHS